jgi:ATP adenylyltransferase
MARRGVLTKKSRPKSSSSKKAAAKAAPARVSGSSVGRTVGPAVDRLWPTERQVLFRPERMRYVRKMIKPKGCVFCAAVALGVGSESLLLHKGKHAIIVLNKYPYNTGHVLILPLRHTGEFAELSDQEHAEISSCLRKMVKVLTDVYQPAGFNVGLNLGSASGAGIPEHLHYHVIPRWNGDTNFFPLIGETKVVIETLEQTFAKLIPFFAGARS